MGLGSTKARHRETAASLLKYSIVDGLRDARQLKEAGRCDEAITYAFSVHDAAGKFMAHVVAADMPRAREKKDINLAREYQAAARRIIESCCKR